MYSRWQRKSSSESLLSRLKAIVSCWWNRYLNHHLIWRETCQHRSSLKKAGDLPWIKFAKMSSCSLGVGMVTDGQRRCQRGFLCPVNSHWRKMAALQDLGWTNSRHSRAWECGSAHCADTTFNLGSSSYATSLIFLSGSILFSAATLT